MLVICNPSILKIKNISVVIDSRSFSTLQGGDLKLSTFDRGTLFQTFPDQHLFGGSIFHVPESRYE